MKFKIVLLLSGLLLAAVLSAQQKTSFVIEGTIYDETGDPVPGATVYIKDRLNIGTASDNDGKFRIKADKGDILVFSYIGYKAV